MTTLLCIPLAVLLARRLPFPVTRLLLCFCKPAAAAIETPAVDDRNEKKLRRKAEENSLTVFLNVCVEIFVNSFRRGWWERQWFICTLKRTIS
jgi:hypothetical protein